MFTRKVAKSIREIHSTDCSLSHGGKRCSCAPRYEVSVASGKAGVRAWRRFSTLAEAEVWRQDELARRKSGAARSEATPTINDALDRLFQGMEVGVVRNRSGKPYKPSAIDGYRSSAKTHLRPAFGHRRLADIDRREVQKFVDRLLLDGLAPQTVKNILMPLQVVVRLALRDGTLTVSPVDHLDLPAGGQMRTHVAEPATVPDLIDALSVRPGPWRKHGDRGLVPSETAALDRACWAMMFYGGLRLGEAQATTWQDVDFKNGILYVRHSWYEPRALLTDPKSEAGKREVIMPSPLVRELEALRAERRGEPASAFVLRGTTGKPITQQVLRKRAKRTWEAQGLEYFIPHEARHTFGSMMAASGTQAWDLALALGQSDPTLAARRYRHQYAHERRVIADRFETYLEDQRADREDESE